MTWNLQNALDCLDGAAPAAVVTAPRWSLDDQDGLQCEADHAVAGCAGAMVVPPLSQRSVAQIVLREAGATDVALAADPRTGARAGGY